MGETPRRDTLETTAKKQREELARKLNDDPQFVWEVKEFRLLSQLAEAWRVADTLAEALRDTADELLVLHARGYDQVRYDRYEHACAALALYEQTRKGTDGD